MNSTARQSNGSTMSTLESIAAELPNGFHDSSLRRVVVDYVDRRATLALNVWVGDLKAATDAEREAYRSIDVTISGLLWCIIEPRLEPPIIEAPMGCGLMRVQ